MNGILRYFSRKDSLYFNNSNIFTYNSSGTHLSYYAFNAFYFESDSYWIDLSSNNVFLSFCFVRGFADLKGYEIHTLDGKCRPYKWSFSASNDENNWFGNKQEEHLMQHNETYYVDWNKGPAKCYKFDFILNAQESGKGTDIMQIELFGRYFDNSLRLLTCRGKRNTKLFMFSLMIMIS